MHKIDEIMSESQKMTSNVVNLGHGKMWIAFSSLVLNVIKNSK